MSMSEDIFTVLERKRRERLAAKLFPPDVVASIAADYHERTGAWPDRLIDGEGVEHVLCRRCHRLLRSGEIPPLCADCEMGSE